MLCRISAGSKNGRQRHAYYTLRSDTSSRFLRLCGGFVSHFRNAMSSSDRVDDGDTSAQRKSSFSYSSMRSPIFTISSDSG